MTTLPDDIVLYHILPRLPSKTLLRFRFVCKSWDAFIRHPSFLHLRKLTNNHTHHLLFLTVDPQVRNPDLLFYSQPHVYCSPHPNSNIITTPLRPSLLFAFPNLTFCYTGVQCVNGLLCFHPRHNVYFCSFVRIFTLIANRTTGQVLTLPLDHSLPRKESFPISTHFGFDPVRDEFKVLRWIKYHDCHEIKVFTIGGDTPWRVLTPDGPFALMLDGLVSAHENRGLCVNGAIYWTYRTALVIFDVRTEQFREMPAPPGYSYRAENAWPLKRPDLLEIDGCLCLVEYSSFDLMKLWILRDYQAQVWEQKTIVLPSGVVPPQQVVFPLCRVPTGEILLLSYFAGGRFRGIYYDMDKTSSRSVVVLELPHAMWSDDRSGEVDIVFCQESFRLLK